MKQRGGSKQPNVQIVETKAPVMSSIDMFTGVPANPDHLAKSNFHGLLLEAHDTHTERKHKGGVSGNIYIYSFGFSTLSSERDRLEVGCTSVQMFSVSSVR